jgi:hypothetical protein
MRQRQQFIQEQQTKLAGKMFKHGLEVAAHKEHREGSLDKNLPKSREIFMDYVETPVKSEA